MPGNSKSRDQTWFGLLPEFSTEFANAVMERFRAHEDGLEKSHRHDRMRRSWLMYYSFSTEGYWDDTQLQRAGERGELTLLKPNNYRNLIQHQVSIVTQAPPSYEAVAVNTDSESLAQAQLGNGVLDYYNKTYGIDDLRVKRTEIALVLGESFLIVPWDYSAGKTYAVKEERGKDGETIRTPVYEGDLVFSARTPYEVAYDPLSPDLNRPRWIIVKEPALKYDLATTFKEHRDKILDSPTWSSWQEDWQFSEAYEHDDYCAVYRVYFERCPARADGRSAIVLDEDTVLIDGNLDLPRAPTFRLAPSDVIMRAGGYTNSFDVMPVAECYGNQMSTILSNHAAFGGQIIATPKGSSAKPHQLGRGLTILEYDPLQGVPPPQAISLLATQREHLTFLDVLKREMETLSAVNAVVRGDISATKGDSGAKDALIHATAQQFASGLAGQVRRSDEAILTHVLATLATHATTQRVATIAGKYNTYASREFTGKDLQKIARVIVRAADPMRDTYEGRMILADKVMGLPDGITTFEQYITFISTGRTEPLYEATNAELMLIRRENEMLRDVNGTPPEVAPGDKHALHWNEHKCLLADPEIRKDPARWQKVWAHMQQHQFALTPGHPGFVGVEVLLLSGQNPLPMPPPPDQINGPPAEAKQGPNAEPPNSNGNGKPQPQGKGAMGRPDMPQMPMNPATGERAPGAAPPPPAITQA